MIESRSVLSDSLWPHGLYSPWNSPDQNTGVGSRSLLQGIFPNKGSNPGLLHCRQILAATSWATREAQRKPMLCYAKSLQSCLTLCDPIDGSPPGSPPSLGFSRQDHWSGLPNLERSKWPLRQIHLERDLGVPPGIHLQVQDGTALEPADSTYMAKGMLRLGLTLCSFKLQGELRRIHVF